MAFIDKVTNDIEVTHCDSSPLKACIEEKFSSPPLFRRRKVSPLNTSCKGKKNNEDFKPIAGSTSIKIEKTTDPATDRDGNVFAGWREVDPTTVQVRGVDYSKSKIKVNSPGDLYRCVKADVFESQQRFPDMASRVVLPNVEFIDDHYPKTWNAPDLFIITVAIPTDPPSFSRGNNNLDGAGYTITMYFAMQQHTRDILREITAEGYDADGEKEINRSDKSKVNAVRLLEKWCRRAPTDNDFMSRFKVIPRADNLKELGLPSWISKFNGKPFLVKRPGETGLLFSHPEKSCMEFDVSLHPFPYLAKKGIRFMKDSYFKKAVATFAFCLEGREEDELPECLIGAFQLCYPDPIHAIQGENFFAGTCLNTCDI
mmetsp:Transcript_23155/g.54669  ORF Transcript_23155/g.54669 Transcript_23155/m.54669 type:complete len:371 (-) Transcript_23155:153-1265(-)